MSLVQRETWKHFSMVYSNNMLKSIIQDLKDIAALSGIDALLSWDQEVYMPPHAIDARGEQIGQLSSIIHAKQTSPEFKEKLSQLIDLDNGKLNTSLNENDAKLVQEIYKDWLKNNALPADFVANYARVVSKSQHVWQQARNENNFELFAPYLEKIITLNKQKANYIGYTGSPYNALLDEYEPGMTVNDIDPIFAEMGVGCRDLLIKIQTKQTAKDRKALDWNQYDFDETAQWNFGMTLLEKIGFDFKRGRQDKSTHPFTTTFDANDIRVTTRISKHNVMEALSSTIHEGGHALYEQGLPIEDYGTPFGEATSLAVHESQSRLWENWVVKSKLFWEGHYESFQKAMSPTLEDVDLDTFYNAITHIQPSFIRVEADELTYQLHILIRYEIEKEMINGTIKVSDLPKLWDDKYEYYMGIRPKTPAEGILQDVHWSAGLIGYFPTYSLGNMMAAQLYETLLVAFPTLHNMIKTGDFLPIKTWLNTHVHSIARRKNGRELIESVTGKPLSATALLKYLKEKLL